MAPSRAVILEYIKANDGKAYKIKSFINRRRIFWAKKDDFYPEILTRTKSNHLLPTSHHVKLSPIYPWGSDIKGIFSEPSMVRTYVCMYVLVLLAHCSTFIL